MSKQPLLSVGMAATMLAQFFSAFADNAIFFAILAFIKQLHYPEWSQSALQIGFVIPFILLSPFVGQFADSMSKGKAMMIANGVKLLGAAIICLNINPFLGYFLVGVGAAGYSPAKYGILGELTSGDNLVKANGLIEASTIAAILLGSLAGGHIADLDITLALLTCVVMYGLAVIANIFIPKLPAARQDIEWKLISMIKDFAKTIKIIFNNKQALYTLLGTSLFWGAGITLRFLLISWVPIVLGITDNSTPTNLNAVVAIGIVIGAALASALVSISNTLRCIPAGILMGFAVIAFTLQSNMISSYILLVVIGALGGYFLVPLNALIQKIGKELVGAGSVISIQNLSEYSAMMIMLSAYTLAVACGLSVITIGVGFGMLFVILIAFVWLGLKSHAKH
ncbi:MULTISPECIES: lysophospholipid transporter LplT [unclassified Gilliamella]|uniref:lysophospholipid transporter LplT n=1 Tax=unclassified Gilliamella TaxID=2685620 RepID=UPI0018DE3BD7|nr:MULTISPECIES: lysophospholipid transporter LplT [unclassified Gilliamella]MBI0038332.1 lysophospholipid transporter LplT [Gilliamella sp. B14384G10]MBI0040371.1 lysophospholipid transporter LplT [Gilliamella sp. B14384G7]MBI0052210.1 lysophospholipid transporter LplT [Gilliamella sp. B14384G13]MBI0054619.1 lysophospholipid transporter LplT [Gilliamella sp. B14384H2]MBI0104168.1 lysophospholipid transporter LplT [Gilliamella sp. W8145]